MEKFFSIIRRSLLVLGVLLVLSPCDACQQLSPSVTVCSMRHMTTPMNCCHSSKPMNPMCKVMNQSTVTPSVVHLPVVASSMVTTKVFQPRFLFAVRFSVVPAVVESPPRSSAVLRI